MIVAIRKCVVCNQVKEIVGKNMCGKCYHNNYRQNLKREVCKNCGIIKPIYAKGECKSCRDKASRAKRKLQ